MGSVKKFPTFSHFVLIKMFVIKDCIHKTLVRIANGEDPDQTASFCLSRPFSRQLVFKILEHLPCHAWMKILRFYS